MFTSDGDMRQGLNNLQSTNAGFGIITPENVFKVCDQPHPLAVAEMIKLCITGDIDEAHDHLEALWKQGYAASDIIGTIFKVVRNHQMDEHLKLEFIRVSLLLALADIA